jgi:MFS family permease
MPKLPRASRDADKVADGVPADPIDGDELTMPADLPVQQDPADASASPYPPLARGILAFAFLMVAEFFYSWAWNSVDVLRPYMRSTLGLTLTQVGSGYSAQGAGALIGAIVIGQLGDRFGRRGMLVMVMIGYGLSLIAGTTVTSYFQFLLDRFVLGLFMGGIFPIVVGIYVGLFANNVGGRLAALINAVFSSAITVLGFTSGAVNGDWRLLLWLGGIPPILLAGLALVLIPKSADSQRKAKTASASAPILELFAPAVRTQTLLLATLTGLNFFGYQAFSGWLSTYLHDVRNLTPVTLGDLIAWQSVANVVGGLFWGWASDQFGRRFNALGFLVTGVAILVYLNAPTNVLLLGCIGAVYGFMLSSSVVWGPWLTELYPAHLKSTAASIFNWGRIVSFFAPLITGSLASSLGLGLTMSMASLIFFIAGGVWLSLPETHAKPLLRPWIKAKTA